jgi:hypothetical protein
MQAIMLLQAMMQAACDGGVHNTLDIRLVGKYINKFFKHN